MIQQNPTMRVVLDEVFKTNFSIFDSYETIARTQQIQKLNYIETIASQLEKNLTGVNLFDILSNNNNIILADEGEINTALIKFDRSVYFTEPEEEHKIIKLSDVQLSAVRGVYKTQFENKKNDIEYSIKSCINDAASYHNRYTDYMSKANEYRQELDTIKMSDAEPMVDGLNKILADPRFEFEKFGNQRVENDTVWFKIKDDIINTHVNERAGINLRVNLGKMKFRLQFNAGIKLTVHCSENNLNYRGYYHPHIGNDNGSICLGNMKELFEESQRNGDIHEMLNVTMAILSNYNDGDPYIALAHFATASKQVQPNGEVLTRDMQMRTQYHSCYECEAEFEIEFQPEGDSDYAHEVCPECDHETEYEYYYD